MQLRQPFQLSQAKTQCLSPANQLHAGQVFFASSDSFTAAFDYKEVLDRVVIDVSQSHFWDISASGTLDKAILKFRREGTEVEVIGLNEASAAMIERFAVHDKPGAEAQLGAH